MMPELGPGGPRILVWLNHQGARWWVIWARCGPVHHAKASHLVLQAEVGPGVAIPWPGLAAKVIRLNSALEVGEGQYLLLVARLQENWRECRTLWHRREEWEM